MVNIPGSKQLLAKLARMAGIELKIQAHRARYARKCFESPGRPMIAICLRAKRA